MNNDLVCQLNFAQRHGERNGVRSFRPVAQILPIGKIMADKKL